MKIITSLFKMQSWSKAQRMKQKTIGLVPTMGALHEGHLSLVRKSVKENDLTIVSIFVNPIQFGPTEDFKQYPRPLKKDCALLKKEKVDIVFIPTMQEMYPFGFSTYVEEQVLSQGLCGAHRPGHFRGVTTVVCKLFHGINPHKAYFGEKDYQQLKIIQKIVKDLALPVTIIPCPIIRGKDGLALSSRNAYLNAQERQCAIVLYQSLQRASEMIQSKTPLKKVKLIIQNIWKNIPTARLEYFSCVNSETLQEKISGISDIQLLIAGWVGKTRLIDTMLVHRS